MNVQTSPVPECPVDGIGLDALAARLHEDLRLLNWPAKAWIPPRRHDGAHVHDAVIVGGGMCGLVAWMGLQSAGIRDVRILDRAPAGREGPWLTYARMETLRSPKILSGPAFDHGALSFQAWFRAQHGAAEWDAVDKIPRPMWAAYLGWYREVLGIPVENGVALEAVGPEGEDLLRLETSAGPILARRLVMATGRDGTGGPNIPDFMDGVERTRWAHSADDIDFAALKGKRVAVIGIGASAIDNSAEALEAGAAEVRHLIRRDEIPTINKMMGIGSFGFSAGFPELPDAWRWRFMNYSFTTQTPPPRGSMLRVSRHANAHFHTSAPVTGVRDTGRAIEIALGDDSLEADFLILGTGFLTDPMGRTELGAAAGEIELWRDAYTPPPGEENRDLSLFPYLSDDFSFREKTAGAAPWLARVHCFNYGATASLGKISGDIPGISEGSAWLARAMAAALYAEDIEKHWNILQDYDKPELEGDEWTPTPLPRRKDAVA